jgi:hypothetical protein
MLISGVALLVPCTATAQHAAVEVGFLGGPTWNTMTRVPSATWQSAGHLGAFASFGLGGGVAFRPEVIAARKQVSLSSFGAACPVEVLCLSIAAPSTDRATFTWLEVPLLAEWRPASRPVLGLTPRVFAGPFVAVRVGAVSCVRTSPFAVPDGGVEPQEFITSCDGDYGRDSASPASTGDAGFILGGVLRRGALGVGARWTRSLTDAVRPALPGASHLEGARHSTLSLFIEVAPFSRR